MTQQGNPEAVSVGLAWSNRRDVGIEFANVTSVSLGMGAGPQVPDSIIVSFGRADPPLLHGTPEEVRTQAMALGSIEIGVLGRYAMSRERVQELIAALAEVLNQYEHVTSQGRSAG